MATLVLLLNACAGAPPAEPAAPAPAALDPAGTYDLTVYAQGMQIGGVLMIKGSTEAGYTGTLNTDIGGGPVSNVAVDGQTLTFSLTEFGAEFEVVFEGDEFSGYVASSMGDGDVVGVKRSG
jgi:hypothetical protein